MMSNSYYKDIIIVIIIIIIIIIIIRIRRTLYKQKKYSDLRSDQKRLPNHQVGQENIVFDFLGGYNKQLLEDSEGEILRGMQKAIISNTFTLTRAFKFLAYVQVQHIHIDLV